MTKIHAVIDGQGLAIQLCLTTGQSHDGQVADDVLDQLGTRILELIDKAYDANHIRVLLRERGWFANIPPKSNRRPKLYFSPCLYRERNVIERFFSKLKHFRRVATRYDELAENFLAMVSLASIRLWLRIFEATAQRYPVRQGAIPAIAGRRDSKRPIQ